MTQELGKIQRPEAGAFTGKRKLLLVPLMFASPNQPQEGQTLLQKYWVQMQSQVESLESTLGKASHIYHENLGEGGDEGLVRLEAADERSHRFVKAQCSAGAVLEATEDEELLLEVMDLQRCLTLPFASERLASKLHEWYFDSMRQRYEHIAKAIDETLGENEVGILLISERHQVQFPQGLEVIYVSPPALDEYRRWLQAWLKEQQSQAASQASDAAKAQETEEGQ